MAKAVIIYSGGVDSYTLLNTVIRDSKFTEVYALSVDYGQRHNKELVYAAAACKELNVPHQIINLGVLKTLLSASSLTSEQSVPHGHYEDVTMRQTVVPNRNMILASITVGYAITMEASDIFIGVHAGDHAIYPDCRPEFIGALNTAIKAGNYDAPVVNAPFLFKTKGEIAVIGKSLELDYSKAWTCYDPIGTNVQWRPNTTNVSLEWVTGFFEGDGSFSRKKNKDQSTGKVRYYPSFNFTQNEPSPLHLIKEFLGFGCVSKTHCEGREEMWQYSTGGGNTCRKFAMFIGPLLKTDKRKKQYKDWVEEFDLLDIRDAKACGKCGACQERKEAMEFSGATDNMVYADANEV